MPSITGKCKWASVQQPNTKFEPVWSIDVIVDNEVTKNKLIQAGLVVKTDKDGDDILKVKRKVNKRDGGTNDAPEVVDDNGNVFTALIGNGSTVKVNFGIFEYNAMGSSGMTTWLNRVTVLDHVPYEDDIDFSDDSAEPAASAPAGDDFDDDTPF